ncbi:MAG: YihY/virulence factor BrkB family protein [Hyphomicrobiales bacterium]
MLKTLAIGKRILGDASGHFNRDDGWAIASHVALSALMALFPFLIFVAALASFLGSEQLAGQAATLLFEAWPREIAEPLAEQVHILLTEPRGDLLTISIGIALYLASNGVEGARVGLNRAYRQAEARSFWYRRLQSLIFVVLGAFGILALTFLLVLAPLVWEFAANQVPMLGTFEKTVLLWRFLIATGVLSAVLITAHLWLPMDKRKLNEIWPGVLFTLVLWVLGASAFSLYLQNFSSYVSTYASLASAMIAIVFLYIIAVILILGGELNAAIIRYRKARMGLR